MHLRTGCFQVSTSLDQIHDPIHLHLSDHYLMMIMIAFWSRLHPSTTPLGCLIRIPVCHWSRTYESCSASHTVRPHPHRVHPLLFGRISRHHLTLSSFLHSPTKLPIAVSWTITSDATGRQSQSCSVLSIFGKAELSPWQHSCNC